MSNTNQSPEQAARRLAEAGLKRLMLNEALEVAGQLYDELSVSRGGGVRKLESSLDVLRELAVRRIVLDKLALELGNRKLLPVTLNTLSTLFSQVYSRMS